MKPPYREMDQTFPALSTAERLHLKGSIYKFFSYFVHWFQVYKRDIRDISIMAGGLIGVASVFCLGGYLLSKIGSFLQSKIGLGWSLGLLVGIVLGTAIVCAIVGWVRQTNETLHRQILAKYESKKS